MRVKFSTARDKVLLDMEMESVPRRDETIVIGDILYEIINIKHVFTVVRSLRAHTYVAVVIIQPL